jgi:hypothetical protein
VVVKVSVTVVEPVVLVVVPVEVVVLLETDVEGLEDAVEVELTEELEAV